MSDTEKDSKRKDLKEPLLTRDGESRGPRGGPPPFGMMFDDSKEVTSFEAMKRIFSIACFPMIGMLFHPAYHLCNSIILGQKTDPLLLSAYGLGNLTLSIFLLCIAMSFNGSLDTLISQAFGQRDKRLCWVYLNRQLYLTTIIYIPLSLFLFFACEPMYLALGQDPQLSAQATIFVKVCIPGILSANWGSCFARFSSGQRVMIINMYAVVGSSLIHFPLSWYLSIYLEMDMLGIAIASSIQFVVRFIICILYIKLSGKFTEGYVSLLHEDCFKNWKSQFSLSLQAASLGIWSWVAFDVFTLIASYLSIAELASQTILRNIGVLTYMVPVAIAQSSGILVGNMIGANNAGAAKVYIRTSSLTACIWAILSVIFIHVFKGPLIDLFTNAPEVSTAVLGAYSIVSLFVFVDCIQGVAQGVIRGMGKQGVASIATVFGYWVLGIPISLVAVFYYDGGLFGLWIGITFGIIFNSFFYYGIVLRTDMSKLSQEADQRRLKEKIN